MNGRNFTDETLLLRQNTIQLLLRQNTYTRQLSMHFRNKDRQNTMKTNLKNQKHVSEKICNLDIKIVSVMFRYTDISKAS